MSVIAAAGLQVLCREVYHREQHQLFSGGRGCSSLAQRRYLWTDRGNGGCSRKKVGRGGVGVGVGAFWADLNRPTVIEMERIDDCDQLEKVLQTAAELSQPILIDWMASWCRKCIYLKPKLEKLAPEYENKIKFYYVDVNKVPQPLVKLGNISKMPTIQVWKDGEMKAEVIGGQKAWLVIEEVKEMIQKFI